jgi:hypothetical protein
MKKPSEETVTIELVFSENDTETVEFSMEEFLRLKYLAESNNMPIEDYFNHLIEKIVIENEEELSEQED